MPRSQSCPARQNGSTAGARKKAEEEGASKAQIKKISRQSVIAERPLLRKAYEEVSKKMMIAYCVEVK